MLILPACMSVFKDRSGVYVFGIDLICGLNLGSLKLRFCKDAFWTVC